MPRSRQFSRRQLLQQGTILGAGLFLTGLPGKTARLQNEGGDDSMYLELTGQLRQVHDPVIIKEGDTYYCFCTGVNIPVRKSADLLDWEMDFPATVVRRIPEWAQEYVPGANNIWAPDISYHNGRFQLYYSVSTFGSNHSCIGLLTNETLNVEDDRFEWVDQGMVVSTTFSSDHNAIDPNWVLDAEGGAWLSYGSFWTGIKMVRLDPETGLRDPADDTVYSLCRRFVEAGSTEAPFIIRKNGFYYLFVSYDFCCRGADSTYRVMVGRSEAITGPYVDHEGVELMQGGGLQVTYPNARWKGPGHCAILQDDGIDYLVHHAYDADVNGTPTLRIAPLTWDDEGWPRL